MPLDGNAFDEGSLSAQRSSSAVGSRGRKRWSPSERQSRGRSTGAPGL